MQFDGVDDMFPVDSLNIAEIVEEFMTMIAPDCAVPRIIRGHHTEDRGLPKGGIVWDFCEEDWVNT